MLPTTFGSSLWFSEEELAELEGTTLYRATVIQVRLCPPVLLEFTWGYWVVIKRKLLFQRKSMQSLFDEKVKGLVEELLHVDDSARFVVSLRHFVLIFIQQAKP